MKPRDSQPKFKFNRGSTRGYESWLEERRQARRDLAARLGLPIDHRVEVWLRGGIRLNGVLRLKEEQLFVDDDISQLELTVDGVDFQSAELESCVRQD